jgi:hypothetical protein
MAVDRICAQCSTLHTNSGELNHPLCEDCVRELLDQLEIEDPAGA